MNQILNIDCRDGLAGLDDGSVDIIMTDPPYLAEHGPRVLRPGGWLITYAPQYHLPPIMRILEDSGLQFWWIVAQLNQKNANAKVWARHVMAMWKPILIYCKPPSEGPAKAFCDLVSGKRQKAYHPWQQSIHEALHLLTRFARDGDLIVDPFCGSGTVPMAAKLLGLRYLGYEIDPEYFTSAVARLQQTPLDLYCHETTPIAEAVSDE